MAGSAAEMERKFRLLDAAYCFLTRNRATLSVRNVVQMVNGLSAGALDATELRAMAALAPDLLTLHTAQQKQLTHRDDVFRGSELTPDQLQLVAFPSVPQITARASDKRVKLFLAALQAAPPPQTQAQTQDASTDAHAEPPTNTEIQEPAEPTPVASTEVPSSPWVDMLRGLDLYRNQIVHVETRPARSASLVPLSSLPLPAAVVKALQTSGVEQLYSHQHEAIAATLRGDNVVISTSTASGKSLTFNVPALTELATAPQSTFFYLFPTKALAQDQLKSLRRLLHATGMPERLCATFDGDTPMKARSMVIRDAQIFLTNPDIMHLTVLPKHSQWRAVLANLKLLVVDEAHMYRGVFGAHVASVFRRFFRLCALYGSNPRVICCSATIRNPEAHFRMLLPKLPPRVEEGAQEEGAQEEEEEKEEGKKQRPANFDFFHERPLRIITQDGAPTGEKIYCVWNPKVDKHSDTKTAEPQAKPMATTAKASGKVPRKRKRDAIGVEKDSMAPPATDTAADGDAEERDREELAKWTSTSSIYQSAKIFSRLVEEQIHTILFCKGRKLSELVLMSVHSVLQESDKTKHLIRRVHTYRGGYTVEDRRRIERRLFDGELLGVIATNALELGIDIGELDCTMHLGLPTSISSLWQQAGRAGRKHTQQSLAVIVCFDAPLDQYFARHASELFQLSPEAVSLNPHNTKVVAPHLLCAASEYPLFDTRSGLAYVDSYIFDDSNTDDKERPTVAALLQEQVKGQQIVARTEADGGGFRLHSNTPKSFRSVSLRSISEINYTVVTDDSDQHVLDQVPGELVFFQVYPTGVYLHQAQEYIITRVDVDQKLAFAKRCAKPLTYFTACRDYTAVDVVKVFTRQKLEAGATGTPHAPGCECYGNVSVTTTVFGTTLLEKRTMRVLHTNEFMLPPMQHFGHALWLELPHTLKREVEAAAFVWAGALHGVGHLLLAVVPLFVLCDAGDINTEHYNPLERRERPNRVTIYERRAGGSGVVEEIQRRLKDIVHRAWVIASECECVSGCPSCIHSAQCTEYNKVLDKRGSLLVLEFMARAYGLLQD